MTYKEAVALVRAYQDDTNEEAMYPLDAVDLVGRVDRTAQMVMAAHQSNPMFVSWTHQELAVDAYNAAKALEAQRQKEV